MSVKTLSVDSARELVSNAFGALSVPSGEIELVVDALLDASLTGYDSHGLVKLPVYVSAIERGDAIPGAELKELRRTHSSAFLDCNFALGPVSATYALGLAAEMAESEGIGCVSCSRANYISRLGGYVEKIAQQGKIAVVMANDAGGFPSVAPTGSSEALLSTNPIAAGIPRANGSQIVIDLSTSSTALGRMRLLAQAGLSAPEGHLIDEQGRSSQDPGILFSKPKTGALLPLGGLLSGYKGYALSLLVDVLAGGLSGAGCSVAKDSNGDRAGFFCFVIEPDHFISRQGLAEKIEELVAAIKQTRTLESVDKVLIPGERLVREREKRMSEGIRLDEDSWSQISATLEKLGIEHE